MAGRQHTEACERHRCVDGCDIYELKVHLGRPVLADEVAEEKANEERLKAFAARGLTF